MSTVDSATQASAFSYLLCGGRHSDQRRRQHVDGYSLDKDENCGESAEFARIVLEGGGKQLMAWRDAGKGLVVWRQE